MDFPPLDDTRWDRLLGAVIGQRPTVGDPDAPLATSFPSLVERRATEPTGAEAEQGEDVAPVDEDVEDAHGTIDLDAFA